MSKAKYENYRYTGEVCQVKTQSVVECRFPGAEMATVLAVQARVVESKCVCADGEVKYDGKLLLGVLYEDGSKRICRAERGAEFYHKASHAEIAPACFAKGEFSVQSVSHRREGASTYVSVVVDARIDIYKQAETEYLSGGEEIVVKKERLPIVQISAVSGETEETDDFSVDGVVDVLLHEEWARATACHAKDGEIEIVGELCYDVCALKEDGELVRYERILPLRTTLPCEESSEEDGVKADLEVRRAEVSIDMSEEDNRAKITFSCGVFADCSLYKKEGVEMGVDAISPCQKLRLHHKKVAGRYLINQKSEEIRVAGTASCQELEEGWSLSCVCLPTVELNPKEGGIEGILEARALVKKEEEGYRSVTLSLPFALECGAKENERVDCVVSGLSVRNFGKETTQLEGTLKLTVYTYSTVEADYVAEVEEGEEIPKKTCAFSVYLPKKGDGVWEVAKKMGVTPEEVTASNPTVEFPVQEGTKIVVYRQKV
ncbi:MAG: hypothetical protein IKC37_04450 [Clostridia bacterium]|nr:hypothetical protein [Clostridia bacterium]